MATRRKLDDALDYGRKLQSVHELQAIGSGAAADDIVSLLDVSEVDADAQPKKITLQQIVDTASIRIDDLDDVTITSVSNGQILTYNSASGAWVNTTSSSTVAGSNTQIQFNNSGTFGASADFTWNDSTKVLSVNGKVSFALGTAALPSLYPGTDTNTGIWSPAADTLAWSTNGSERARIDSSGRVGIGTTAPTRKLVLQDTGATYFKIAESSLGETVNDGFDLMLDSGATAYVWNRENGALAFGTNNLERARITSDGYLRLTSGTGGIQFNGDTAAANALDDYEEGTWTPSYLTDTGDPSYTITTTDSVYTKIGRLVALRWYAVISGYTGSGGGNVRVRGIPFTPASTEFIVGRGGYTATDTAPDVRTSWTGFDVVSDSASPRNLYLKGVSATTLVNTVAFFTVVYRV